MLFANPVHAAGEYDVCIQACRVSKYALNKYGENEKRSIKAVSSSAVENYQATHFDVGCTLLKQIYSKNLRQKRKCWHTHECKFMSQA